MARISKRDLQESLTSTNNRLEAMGQNYIHTRERLAELELALDSVGYFRVNGFDGREFPKDFLNQIYELALTSFIKNPLTNHGVKVQGNYVWGQGVTIVGKSPEVNKLWQLFWDHPSNRIEFTSYQALFLKEVDLQLEGNLFLALFTAPKTGAVQIRSIISSEITDIITNPEDAKEPWYYKRVWSEMDMSDTSGTRSWSAMNQKTELYPTWNYRPKFRPPSFRSMKINWDAPIYHKKVGGTSHMRFGVTEIYSALDWATAMTEAMGDYATVRKCLAMFAHQLTTRGGKEGVAAGKAKLNTTFGDSGNASETKPAPVKGSTFIGAEGMVKLEVLKTSGAQSHPEEARYLAVMAAAGFSLSYAVLTGDADKSNLATATSLDRPTELNMQMRQRLWTTIFEDINTYLVRASVRAPRGVVKGTIVVDEWGTEQVMIKGKAPRDGGPIPTGITVDFPPILEHDVSESIKAIVSAATLDGKTEAGIFDKETLIRQLASTLGMENIDTMIEIVLDQMEDEGTTAEEIVQEVQFIEVLKELREVLQKEQQDDN